MSFDLEQVTQKVQEQQQKIDKVFGEISKHVVGQRYMTERLVMGLLAGGHVLLEGVPGLAKTTTVNALAQALQSNFKRIQFTPDLLPADLIGTQIYSPKTGDFYIKKGPVFANIVLADEINRAPAKVQSALLEAMGERQVTVGRETYPLPELFLVMATQNPLEQEGTYPLPEAQLDRFLMLVLVDYPQAEDELQILQLARQETDQNFSKQRKSYSPLPQEVVFAARQEVLSIYIAPELERYLVELILATRKPQRYLPELASKLQVGASPRGTIALDACARSRAWLQGRDFVSPDDVQEIYADVLRHRILLSYEAEADGWTTDQILQKLLQHVPVP